jgi:methyl-accepting chemotaxis protein
LVIILGLVGTFYGLTLSIGRLAALVSSDATDASLITESLTAGLTQALTGMSVAFSTSLFGIVAAIVMTLLGVFCNVSDRRTALMAQIEAYLDNVLLSGIARGDSSDRLDRSMQAFGQTVERLEGAVGHFESALQTFATSTRDFQEFNLHLKDNVQRMSLGFADLSETLKAHARSTQSRG